VLDPFDPNTSVVVNKECSLSAYFTVQNEPWTYVYLNEFTSRPGPEWSHNVIKITPVGERRYLGQFGNDTVTLTLSDLPPLVKVRLTFDLFIIYSWDGDGISGSPGPDLWSVKVNNNTQLLETTFDNHWFEPSVSFHRQSFPYNYPGPGELPQTGAIETNTLGFVWNFGDIGTMPTDSVYNLSFIVSDSASSISFNFAGSGLQALTDESWGLDNVCVEILEPEPEATLSISSTAGGAVILPGEGDFDFGTGTNVTIQAVTDSNFLFTGWIGTAVDTGKVADPNSTNTSVTVDADYTLEATFIALSTTLYVNVSDSNDPNQYGTEAHPISGIQNAIDVAQNGTKLVIAGGIYKGGLVFGDKDIYLIAQEPVDPNDPNKINHPVIVGDANEPVIIFSGTNDANCILSGFTIKGGTNGIVCHGTNPVITNCIITGNSGYGIALYDSNATIVNCTITGNGGDLLGGGFGCWDSNAVMVNCILWNNFPQNITVQSGSTLLVRYSDIEGSWPGINNLNADPSFAEPGFWADANDPNIIVEPNDPNAIWISGDYHLKSQAGRWDTISKSWIVDDVTSPCIDAGDPNSPIGKEIEPNGSIINMGAYGGTAGASKSIKN
jgi:parallel beta-helix repeat protein